MKNIIKLKRFVFLILIGSIVFFSLIVNNSKFIDSKISLELLAQNACATSECGTGTSEQLRKPKTGAICTCNGQVIIPQTCEWSDNNSCSPITCD